MVKPRVFSGIQPSGELHLGNYYGAIQNWVSMQDRFDCVYCIVDYHAVTSRTGRESDKFQEPIHESLSAMSVQMAGDLIACGIDPQRSILFCQSDVPEHTELAWIFSCVASHGDLARMTQFKEKASRNDYVSVGLFTYPVLQAADILLYRAAKVPVGADQIQHLELARRIGRRFNTLVGEDYFPDVEAELTEGKRIMSLADPSQKMSKSLGDKHYVGLMEGPEAVWGKLRSAVTDSGQEVGEQMSAGVANLFELLTLTGTPPNTIQAFMEQHAAGNIRYGDLKKSVHENIIRVLSPIRDRRSKMSDDTISDILTDGAVRASEIARETMANVRDHVGVGPPRIS